LAKYVVTGTDVSLNGSDISANTARAELVINAAEVDTTDFGSGGFTEVIGGLKSGQVTLDFHNDFGAGGVSNLLKDLVGTIGTVVIDPTGAGAGSTNPVYTAEVLISSFTPIAGAVGDLATFSVTFPTSGSVTFATA